jgi:hypothetical protein
MATLTRIEVWDDVECNSGTRLGFIKSADLLKVAEFLEVSGKEELTVDLPDDLAIWSSLDLKVVLRPVYNDDAYDEYRIHKISGQRKQDGAIIRQLYALGIRNDLQYNTEMLYFEQAGPEVFMHDEYIDITPDDAIDIILAAGNLPPYFSKGTIEPTDRIDLVMDWESPLSALEELAEIVRAELYVRRNGTTDYKIDLLDELNSAADKPVIRFQRNELSASITRDITQMGTRIYPKGGAIDGLAGTIGRTLLYADPSTGPPSTLYFLEHRFYGPASADRPAITSGNDQFNGLYLQYGSTPSYVQITDSYGVLKQRAAVTLASSVTLDDPVYMVTDTSGTEMVSLVSASGIAAYGEVPMVLDRPDIPAVVNIVDDPFGDASGAWADVGTPTITHISRPSAYIKYGDHAHRVQADTGEGAKNVLGGLIWDERGISAKTPHLSFQLAVYVVTGQVEFYFEAWNSVGPTFQYRWPPADAIDGEGNPVRAVTTAEGAPHVLTLEPQKINFWDEIATTNELHFYVKALVDTTDVYIDAIQVVNKPVAAQQIVRGSGASKLWGAAINAFLEGTASPQLTAKATTVDLERLDPTTYQYDAIDRGVTAVLADPGLDMDEERRIYSVRRDLLREGITQIELAEV